MLLEKMCHLCYNKKHHQNINLQLQVPKLKYHEISLIRSQLASCYHTSITVDYNRNDSIKLHQKLTKHGTDSRNLNKQEESVIRLMLAIPQLISSFILTCDYILL